MNIAFITKTPDFEIDFVSIVAFHVAQKNPSVNCYLYYSSPFVQQVAATVPTNLFCTHKPERKKSIHFLANWKQERNFKKQLLQKHANIIFCDGWNENIKGNWKKIVFDAAFQTKIHAKKQLDLADCIVHFQGLDSSHTTKKSIAILPVLFQKNSTHTLENKEIRLSENDFFLLSTNEIEHAVVFLKAYSQFKQWQKSNIQVCVYLPKELRLMFQQKISNYAYRNSIIVMEDDGQYQLATHQCFGHFVWQEKEMMNEFIKRGLLSSTPLFTNESKTNQWMFEDCLGFFENSEKSIFSSMTLLYKETLPIKVWAENRKKFYANNEANGTLLEMEKLIQA
jgi:hypothetical protein